MASDFLKSVAAIREPIFKTRPIQTDDRAVAVKHEASKDLSGMTRSEASIADKDGILSDVRPVIERLDGTRDIADVLTPESVVVEERTLQANLAYKAIFETVSDPSTGPVF